MNAALASDPLRPRPPGGLGSAAALALLVHALLLIALAFGVRWRSSEPVGVTAELWSAVPREAAPPPPPPPPAAQPRPERRVVEPPKPDPQIAIEKARKEREAKERAEREKAERERAEREQAEREKAERERIEKEKAEKVRLEQLARDKRLAELAEKQRKEQLQRMLGQAGGPSSSTGTAAQSSGPSSSYAGRVIARVRPNITLLASVPDDIKATVEVRVAPDGTIVGRKLVKSSGNATWDDAVLRAIDRTGMLPRDVDGRVPSTMLLDFTPNT